jgi:hypothetical protein
LGVITTYLNFKNDIVVLVAKKWIKEYTNQDDDDDDDDDDAVYSDHNGNRYDAV